MLIGNAGEFEGQGIFTLLRKRNKNIKRPHGKDIAVSIVIDLDSVADSPTCPRRYCPHHTQGWNSLSQCCKQRPSSRQCRSEKGVQSFASVPGSSNQLPRLPQDPHLFGSFGVRRSGGNILPTSSSTLVESKVMAEIPHSGYLSLSLFSGTKGSLCLP